MLIITGRGIYDISALCSENERSFVRQIKMLSFAYSGQQRHGDLRGLPWVYYYDVYTNRHGILDQQSSNPTSGRMLLLVPPAESRVSHQNRIHRDRMR
ncbi:hypothetical protein MUK42_34507 [Musa troglodytarum]|uniref:Uncharacterized protein n=1 Tax=Musa troglodytarum TaxID=320322 RepID=A0A9E7HGC9_9LILI|nr:hypothetical protein MUK42_34507 [Musa troglodytarum]